MCGLRASAPPAVRGSGISLRFPLSRSSSSFHLAALVVIVSPCLLRCPPPCRPHPRPLPHVRPFLPSVSAPAPVFSCGFLSLFLPVPSTSWAGRSLLVLPHPFRLSFSRLRVLVLACPPLIVLDRSFAPFSSRAAARPAPRFAHASSPSFVLSPRLATSVGGECGGSFLLACPIVLAVAGGWRCRRDGVGGTGLLLGVAACRLVVFGLCCRCLYI